MRLLKQKCPREGYKDYTDFYLVWTYGNKTYFIRVRPSFYSDFDKLYATAENVPEGEPIEKYI